MNKQSIFADNIPLIFGEDLDLQIQAGATSGDFTNLSVIRTVTNNGLTIEVPNTSTGFTIRNRLGSGLLNFENMLTAIPNGAVSLLFNNRTKLATNDGGITVTGGITASGITTTSGVLDINAGGQANTFKVEDLTAGRVVIAGTGGELEDNSALTFSGSTLSGTFSGTLTGNLVGNSDTTTLATAVQTKRVTSSNHFLTFVPVAHDANGGSSEVKTNSDFYVTPNGSNSSQLFVRGDITAFAGAASDDRLKTKRESIDNALDKVLSLNGFTFEWNELGSRIIGVPEGTKSVGISAQETQGIVPEAVKEIITPEGDDFLSVKYEKLVPLLIEAIKELNGKVEDLQQQLLDK